MAERNVYIEPEDRVLLRTPDVYQTEARDDVTSYSETLLRIVADFRNSGQPEGFNAQSMVGKSKRGEVACRLFARIDPKTGIIEAAGFKTRGCLAMTACASAACLLIEGKGVEEALRIGVGDIRAFVDGVPAGKVNTLHFAACAIQALVGDFLLRDGASLVELQEAVPCDEDSISCIMAEHCSLRQSCLDARLEDDAVRKAAEEEDALADAFDLIRQRTMRGLLTKPADWVELTPASLTVSEFEAAILDRIEDTVEATSDTKTGRADGKHSVPQQAEGVREPSAFANRGVGIPRIFANVGASPETVVETVVAPAVMPETKRALDTIAPAADDDDFELIPPEGYRLVEVDGILMLAETDDPVSRPHRTPDARGIRRLAHADEVYLYDGTAMTSEFAMWAYLADKDDPVTTFAYCVREESRVYPRPLAQDSLANHPFDMDAASVEAVWDVVQAQDAFADICRTIASNGDVYYYSTDHLGHDHARSLAEWESVERYRNV